MKILIVDDDADSAHILEHTLKAKGHSAGVVVDGLEAKEKIKNETFDVLMVDWMLPKMDGIELIRHVRQTVTPPPLVIMLTAISLQKARSHALKAGADDYVAKPYDPIEVLHRIEDGMARRSQPAPPQSPVVVSPAAGPLPRFVGVAIATSTGGPMALRGVLQALPASTKEESSFFVVLHAPDWMLIALPAYLQTATGFTVKLADHRMRAEAGHVYLAPSGKHLQILPETLEMRLIDGEKENFVRPSADPLFRSVAAAFGRYSVAVVLTGMGRDGTQGAAHIAAAGGIVMAQDPETATAPSMPTTLIQAGLASQVPPLEDVGPTIGKEVAKLAADLEKRRAVKN